MGDRRTRSGRNFFHTPQLPQPSGVRASRFSNHIQDMATKCYFLEITDKQRRRDWSDGTGYSMDRIYRRTDTGEEMTLSEATPGAMWYADWMLELGHDEWVGPDGHSLVVKCPNGTDWAIDSRASNCTLPNDSKHKCWIRHGTPPNITVDKNGLTCAAGAGSIQAGDYHGFLRAGQFDP